MLESETMLGKLSQCPPLFWGSTSTPGPRPNPVVGICPPSLESSQSMKNRLGKRD